ncbi:hypothetical protein QR685DRAFT_569750 [Neurospora intermedia]|uniref:Uncharacterized protein n=1 Tax=Neurospora intermedia TaxID=5142 RepID=A0ABR3DM71_NEUIN
MNNGTSVPCLPVEGRSTAARLPTARMDLPGLARSQWCSAGWPGWPVARRARVEKQNLKNKNCGCILCCQCAESAAAQQPLMRLSGSTAISQPVNTSKSENKDCRLQHAEVAEAERHRDGSTQPFILIPL